MNPDHGGPPHHSSLTPSMPPRATANSSGAMLPALVAGALVVAAMATRRSNEAWVLGRWSIAYVAMMAVGGLGTWLALFLWIRFRGRRAVLMVPATGLILALGVTELAGQFYVTLKPSYEVLHLKPDPILGWRPVPGLEFTWAGHEWYARDFSVPIKLNSEGFHDLERAREKTPGSTRIAVIGDSMVEALQVPSDLTATRLAEESLNKPGGRRFEVLNFGVSNYGLGQMFLNWETRVRPYRPDIVFVYVAGLHMIRTVTPMERGAFPGASQESLRVRPTFRIEEDRLAWDPPQDLAKFEAAQADLIQSRFGGGRTRKRPRKSFLVHRIAAGAHEMLMGIQWKFHPLPVTSPLDEQALRLNERILLELNRSVSAAGGRLVVVDACLYYSNAEEPISQRLKAYCSSHSINYVCLSDALLASHHAGHMTHWGHDKHFNELGNQVFADTMLKWLRGPGGIADNIGRQ